ncbi:MAG: PAS domain S-box protein [Desulfofustis sp.]|nr:PAS domain S-box protein [Desulfofustis sp.]
MGSDRGPETIDDNRENRLAGYCLEHASVCTFRLDREGNILCANRKACNSLGYLQAELVGMSINDIDPVMDGERWPQAWKTLTDDGSLTIESRHRRKDGTIFPVAVTATLIDFEGSQYCMALSNDITERKRVEDSLRLTQFIFDEAPLGIFLIKSGGDIINVNDHVCRYLGYTREELCRMNVLEIDRGGYSPQEIDQIWLRQQQMSGIDTFETAHC